MFTISNKYLIGGIVVALCVAGVTFYSQGVYPGVLVNGKIVYMRDIRIGEKMTEAYYKNVRDAYRLKEEKEALIIFSDEEIRAAVVTGEIERVLIEQKLDDMLELSVRRSLVEQELTAADRGEDFIKAAEVLYGESRNTIQAHLLIPQVEKDILRDKLFLEGQDLAAWLKETKTKARIHLFFDGFSWDGEEVVPTQ